MNRCVSRINLGLFRNMLEKRFRDEMHKIGEDFTRTFSREHPDFTMTISVSGYEFSQRVMEQEIAL